MRICVYGAASPVIDEEYIKKVEEFGKELVERGHSLVFGGGGNGLMGAVARGVREKDGKILGVIPSFFSEETIEVIYDKCDKLIETETMRQRKQIMEENADAFVVVPGGIGTLEEFFEILTLKQLLRHNKPIALYNILGYYNEVFSVLKAATHKRFTKDTVYDLFFISDDPQKVFEYVEKPDQKQRSIRELKDG
ncbi:MAG: TIGR00730 family Rossman fold protein [Clostridia bacterium]|nr:TIGR00730 family Rossman fold protein [Clostridia bacterium]